MIFDPAHRHHVQFASSRYAELVAMGFDIRERDGSRDIDGLRRLVIFSDHMQIINTADERGIARSTGIRQFGPARLVSATNF